MTSEILPLVILAAFAVIVGIGVVHRLAKRPYLHDLGRRTYVKAGDVASGTYKVGSYVYEHASHPLETARTIESYISNRAKKIPGYIGIARDNIKEDVKSGDKYARARGEGLYSIATHPVKSYGIIKGKELRATQKGYLDNAVAFAFSGNIYDDDAIKEGGSNVARLDREHLNRLRGRLASDETGRKLLGRRALADQNANTLYRALFTDQDYSTIHGELENRFNNRIDKIIYGLTAVAEKVRVFGPPLLMVRDLFFRFPRWGILKIASLFRRRKK